MLVYLSKKIAIPDDVTLTSLAWHGTKGYIACGGHDGLLKVLKLEPQEDAKGQLKGLAAPTTLTMNQPLQGHESEPVQLVTWNEKYDKLTSSDSSGHIIVWVLYKGVWYEEMVNNRNRSTVRSMQWNRDGKKICIAYEDGAVIVGSVDGNRIWGKEIKRVQLTHVAWSPDSKVILFGTGIGEVHIYDSRGSYNSKVNIYCLVGCTGAVRLAGVEWYSGINGYSAPNCPSLIIVYDNGRAQLMKNELDESPQVIEINMQQVIQVKWNHCGSQLAFLGRQQKDFPLIQFYSVFGEHLYTLKGPGKAPLSIAWEGSGLRLAIGVSQHVYFANIRHSYKWGYFSNTVVYSFRKPEKLEHCLVFWNTKTGEKYAKAVKNLLHVAACRDLALLAAEVDENPGEYVLLLCNALGTPLESKYINMEPIFVAISHTHVVAASHSAVFLWHYRTASRLAASELTHISRKRWEGTERLFHIDETPAGIPDNVVNFNIATKETEDPVCSVCVSDQRLVVGRMSGSVQFYTLPRLALDGRVRHSSQPKHISLNSNSMKFSVIDSVGVLGLYELDVTGAVATQLGLQRKEVWHLVWAEDDPDLFAVMEKTRLIIFRGVKAEEPVQSSAHICQFVDMSVKSVLMDEILRDPENPSLHHHLLEVDIESLEGTRNLLKTIGLKDTSQFIEDNPHPRLWRFLAEAALQQLELEIAEKAFVKCGDYAGIQFVKKLHHLDSEEKQRAQVATYFKSFDEAERLYLELDSLNLAVDLRAKLGDWFKVVKLLKKGGGAAGDDTLLRKTWNTIGDYYYDRQQWARAVGYYSQGHNYEGLAECYYNLEDYGRLEELTDSVPENNPLLSRLGTMFVTVGMSEQAVKAFTKVGMVSKAIDCCVELNQWDRAIELARQHKSRDVSSLLLKSVCNLLEKGKILKAVEIYKKANHLVKAAQLLTKVARSASNQGLLGPLKVKKLYVLAALLIEQHQSNIKTKVRTEVRRESATSVTLSESFNRKEEVKATLASLLQDDFTEAVDSSLIDNAWRGAEAYHFFMMAQRELYTGSQEISLKIALYLRDFEDLLPVTSLYCLLALSALLCGCYGVASKAFIKLESMDSLSDDLRKRLGNLSVEIFTKCLPRDSISNQIQCPRCDSIINEWTHRCTSCYTNLPICIATGQPLLEYHSWKCRTCHHHAYQQDITRHKNCPLCHTPV